MSTLVIYTKKYLLISIILLCIVSIPHAIFAQTDNSIASTISLSSGENIIRGASLPVSIQLLNFGTPNQTTDVSLFFTVTDKSDLVILERVETVAVQTTASFKRYFKIPTTIDYGGYTLKLDVSYNNQKFPAISEQQFTVERSFFGYGLSKWGPALPFALIPIFFIFIIFRRKEKIRYVKRNYAHISKNERTNYEIVHDIIEALHYHVGDKKIHEIVSHIPGLTLSESSSEIKSLEGPTEIIVSQLIHEYESEIGGKVNVIPHPPYPKSRVGAH